MLGKFFSGIKNVAGRVLGTVKEPLRKIGSFIKNNHQPISAIVNAMTSQSENPYVRAIGSGAVLGSTLATRAGIGTNYFNVPPPQ